MDTRTGEDRPTARQHELLVLLNRRPTPSMRELCRLLDIRSTNAIADHLAALERHGWITRTPLASRSSVITAAGLVAIGAGPKLECLCAKRAVVETMGRSVLVYRAHTTDDPVLVVIAPQDAASDFDHLHAAGVINFCPWCGRSVRAS